MNRNRRPRKKVYPPYIISNIEEWKQSIDYIETMVSQLFDEFLLLHGDELVAAETARDQKQAEQAEWREAEEFAITQLEQEWKPLFPANQGGTKAARLLARHGYTPEDIADVPDKELLSYPHFGKGTLAVVRAFQARCGKEGE